MKKIFERSAVEECLRKSKLAEQFCTEGLDFFVIQYQRGELLSVPGCPIPNFQFLVRGSVVLYYLDEGGNRRDAALLDEQGVLGDMEFSLGNLPVFYIEAVTPVTALALPMEKNRGKLEEDCAFLRYLLRQASRVKVLMARNMVVLPRLEERLLFYLENDCLHQTMTGMDDTAAKLHCSRRQLQRVVKKLTEQGKLEKLYKGCYRLQDLSGNEFSQDCGTERGQGLLPRSVANS